MTERNIALPPSLFALGTRVFLWMVQAGLGVFVGLVIMDESVTTKVTVLDQGGRATRVHVVVLVFGMPVHEDTGLIGTEDGMPRGRVTATMEQSAVVFGLLAGGALVGAVGSLGLAWLLTRPITPRFDVSHD